MSPELLDPGQFGLKDNCPTKESDCYALGMVIYEVLSGQAPLSQHKGAIVIILKVVAGERPERPGGTQAMWFTDSLWGMLERCWKPQPRDRPSLKTLLQCLEGETRLSQSPSPTPSPIVHEDVTCTDPSDFTVTNLGPFPISSKTSHGKHLGTGGFNSDWSPPRLDRTVAPPTPHAMFLPSVPGKLPFTQ